MGFIILGSKEFNVVERGGKKSVDMIYYIDKFEKGMSNGNDLGVFGSFFCFVGNGGRRF